MTLLGYTMHDSRTRTHVWRVTQPAPGVIHERILCDTRMKRWTADILPQLNILPAEKVLGSVPGRIVCDRCVRALK